MAALPRDVELPPRAGPALPTITVPFSELGEQALERLRRQRRRNLWLCFYLLIGRQLQSAIAQRDFLDVYLYEVSGTNEFVGKVESTTGLLRLLVLLPLGALADKCDRLCVLKVAVVLKVVPVTLLLAGTKADAIGLLWPGLICMSVADAAIDLLLQVLIVDNVPEPEGRILVLSRKEMVTWASSALGPILALCLLLARDERGWSRGLLRSLIQSGLLLYVLTEPVAFLLSSVELNGAAQQGNAVPAWAQERACGVRKRWLVPIWADAVWAATQVASTVSLRYVPLFFKRDFGLSPAALMVLRAAENGSLAAVNCATPALTRLFGRGLTCVLLVLAGGLFMFGVAWSRWAVLAAVLFVLRTCSARAWLPPLQSIIFECVAAEHRGRWSAVTSFKSATNGLGAWLGGALADRTGDYRVSFVLTASVQSLSAIAFVPVVFWLPRQRPAAEGLTGRA